MALTTLKDRVRAATHPVPVRTIRPAEVVAGASSDELQAAQQVEGGESTDAVMAWLAKNGTHFTRALPAHVSADAFMAAVRAALPGLTRCTPASLLQALLTCARFGLVPDGRHAVITREGSKATFVPMAQGYIELMYRSGRVGSVHVGMVYEGDEWDYEPTAPSPLDFTHKPALTKSRKDRGQPILAYAFCWLQGGARSQVVMLTREDAEEIRDEYSAAYRRAEENGRQDSFWHTHFEDMWRKSCVRRLQKVVPLSAELVQLSAADDAGEGGQVQVLHAPEGQPELVREADAAGEAAEGSQDPRDVPVRAISRQRTQPRRTSRAERKHRK